MILEAIIIAGSDWSTNFPESDCDSDMCDALASESIMQTLDSI